MSDENGSWKHIALEASIRQGPSFIILCAILWGLWSVIDYTAKTAVPAHLQQIQTGYEKIQESHDKNLDRVITSIERERMMLRDSATELKEAVKELKVKITETPDGLRLSPTP